MKYYILILVTFLISLEISSQTFTPISWETKVKKHIDLKYDLGSDATFSKQKRIEYTIFFTANLDQGWHLYSQNEP